MLDNRYYEEITPEEFEECMMWAYSGDDVPTDAELDNMECEYKAHQKARRAHELAQTKRDTIASIWGGECRRCHSTEHIQYHHINPTKKSFTIGSSWRYSMDRLMDEASKCTPLCEECHRKFHKLYGYKAGDTSKGLVEFLGYSHR